MLRQDGFEAIHVSELGMGKADNTQILERARADERVCITLDHDFHSHLTLTEQGRPSVVLLRVQGFDAQSQADLIRSAYITCEHIPAEGAAVSADHRSIRLRRLPLR